MFLYFSITVLKRITRFLGMITYGTVAEEMLTQ